MRGDSRAIQLVHEHGLATDSESAADAGAEARQGDAMIVVRMTEAEAAEIVRRLEGQWVLGAVRELVDRLRRELSKEKP
jgi:hypothetical protein